MARNDQKELNTLVLQGGGALGSFQAGAYEVLSGRGYEPEWLAGISIGAINAGIIAGNEPANRLRRLRGFWEEITNDVLGHPLFGDVRSRTAFNEISANLSLVNGVSGFFRPWWPFAWPGTGPAARGVSFYDTSPLLKTLTDIIDFDYLNERGPRLSLGAVNIKTGNFAYFDSTTTRLGPEHIMASGALPPGFPPVEIDGHWYWDGGLVSNTPLQHVLENSGERPLCIFQIDLFSARGALPESLIEVAQREKDIRYSSRTRLTTDRFLQLHDISAAAQRLQEKLPDEFKDDPDLKRLLEIDAKCAVTLVHLIHRMAEYEGSAKDYEFSRLSMNDHWNAGKADVVKTLGHTAWKNRTISADSLQIFDLNKGDD
ncbi:NTE family protein [Hoeflea marina]|uniref:NTE family protein n=1 Tax=Hoeflea marina TaxID=274592 RepID=A0A317PTQ1_9HYPH|nr:patatin-like phospholipase family protein [Hoeflea marina]PWW04044.1 NTE family protein [Hoeflea marina]